MKILKYKKSFILLICLALSASIVVGVTTNKSPKDSNILQYTVDPKSENIAFYWKDSQGEIIKSIGNLKKYIEANDSELLFAMNGGMFNANFSPQGLFIEDFKMLNLLDTTSGEGNFYLKPNGVFYLTDDNIAIVCKTEDFTNNRKIKYATQSGPMLMIDGEIHPEFKEGSKNVHIRNGVGILPDNKVIFAMSKTKVNLYDFASFFKSAGCQNALYMDGYVSRAYSPKEKWMQLDGNFGVILGVTRLAKN